MSECEIFLGLNVVSVAIGFWVGYWAHGEDAKRKEGR